MSRQARILSRTNIYHIMLRGNQRQDLFHDDNDRWCFLNILQDKKVDSNSFLYAFCLMSNHIHLLLDASDVAKLMRQVNTSYAVYFNRKYQLVGHLFQDRYRSEPIEDDRYLLAVARYIHNNPVNINIVGHPGDYRWSSFGVYGIDNIDFRYIVDRDLILDMFSNVREEAMKLFINFSLVEDDTVYLDVEEQPIRDITTEQEAIAFIANFLRSRQSHFSIYDLSSNKVMRNEIIAQLKIRSTLSARSIASLLNVDRGVVERVKP
ncbi:MAG TPA: transposase [Syntrophomonadaceae bacterium]|nr:transposase [Syntrophomonadaceae bacterium]